MLIKVKKEKTEYDKRVQADRDTRQHFDRLKGLTKTKGAQRGDYKLCRRLDKTLNDYRRFKNPEDRKRISDEYHGLQKEGRKYG